MPNGTRVEQGLPFPAPSLAPDWQWSRLQMGQKVRQVLTACERTPTDAMQINYDPRNPFDLCSLTFTPIYR